MFMAQNVIIIKGRKYPKSITQLYQRLCETIQWYREVYSTDTSNFSVQYSKKLDRSRGKNPYTASKITSTPHKSLVNHLLGNKFHNYIGHADFKKMPFAFIFFQINQNNGTFYFLYFQNLTYINGPPQPNLSHNHSRIR